MPNSKDDFQRTSDLKEHLRATFYRAFEDRFRGDQELIHGRLHVYLPLLTSIKQICALPRALDLGCGRGEWLRVLREQHIEGVGVDTDEGMLESCREQGFKVVKGDALQYLCGIPDATLSLVTGFHIAEHLDFYYLHDLIFEAHRTLVPGGLLVLETPNPENLKVATLSFHLDPTHKSPLPPDFLSFLAEHIGFQNRKIARLQEDESVYFAGCRSLDSVLRGVSPDYALVAQKNAPEDVLQHCQDFFAKDLGIDDEFVIARFDRAEASELKKLADLKQSMRELESATNRDRAELHRLSRELETLQRSQLSSLVTTLRRWRDGSTWLTRGIIAWLTFKSGSRPRRIVRHATIRSGRIILSKPRFAAVVKRALKLHPQLDRRLRTMFAATDNYLSIVERPANLEDLSPNARVVFHALTQAIQNKKQRT